MGEMLEMGSEGGSVPTQRLILVPSWFRGRLRPYKGRRQDASWLFPLSQGGHARANTTPSEASLAALKGHGKPERRDEVLDLRGRLQCCYQCGQHSTQRALVTSSLSPLATLLHARPSRFRVVT